MELSALIAEAPGKAIPVQPVKAEELDLAIAGLDARERRFVTAQGFKAEAGRHVVIPDAEGNIARVLFGLGGADTAERGPLALGRLATILPPGVFALAEGVDDPALAVLAFALASYRFDRYRKPRKEGPRLVVPAGVDGAALGRIRDAVFLTRDLINTPANDLSPHDLAHAASALAARSGASISVTEGEALARGFPMIHAVGAGSDRPPCLIDMRWGHESNPKITLIGKGIVFDTGGLDIKPAASMALMKKDMGGAANVLGLASMIMESGLKLQAPRADPGCRERHFRSRLPSGRRDAEPEWADGRDRQHRCGGPAGSRRCDGACRRGGAGPDHHHGDPHRRRPRCAWPGTPALFHGRCRVCGGHRSRRRRGAGSRLAASALEALRFMARLQGRRPQPYLLQRVCRVDCGGALPPPLRLLRPRPSRISISLPGTRPLVRSDRKAARHRRSGRCSAISPPAMREPPLAPARQSRL